MIVDPPRKGLSEKILLVLSGKDKEKHLSPSKWFMLVFFTSSVISFHEQI
jgi:tRNA/tmRNA/rRNA uracil-C5-methylase (TrmA/RlmC/RlmD family)